MDGETDRRMRHPGSDVHMLVRMRLPTRHAVFDLLAFTAGTDAIQHFALVLGAVDRAEMLVRVHSECLTGDVLGSLRCDCGDQLNESLRSIAAAGRGVLIYLRGHEGRGIGLIGKLRAYALQQEHGLDTVDANVALGQPVDSRDYTAAAALLRHLGVQQVALLTNNKSKAEALIRGGVHQIRIVPMQATVNPHNAMYLHTKMQRLGHAGIGPAAEISDVA
ncbi:MAG: GTP cyclohydrolase II [Actinophytocola sp.]|nr:GTP cyclohydrolase II [Actinophytocola sp.]